MASKFDESEFIDTDYESSKQSLGLGNVTTATMSSQPISGGHAAPGQGPARPPSREEIEAKVTDAHARLAELKRAQEQLERERAALEDARRRRAEFQQGREEMLHHLTRGVELLQENEFNLRRDAEQMARTLADLREALSRVQTLNEETWTQENWNAELTRALTTLENARMEWNSARLKWPVLDGQKAAAAASSVPGPARPPAHVSPLSVLDDKTFMELCQIGLALTWPVALAALLAGTAVAVILLQP